MAWKSLKQATREGQYGSHKDLSTDMINAGCMLRIADSMETIAKSKVDLEAEIERLKKCYAYMRENRDYYSRKAKSATKSRDAYKGLYNRLKNRQAT